MQYFVEMNDHLKAIFTFNSFIEAIDFVNQVADLADEANHHPDILIHDYKNVTLTLTTHEGGNHISDRDKNLARQLESLYQPD